MLSCSDCGQILEATAERCPGCERDAPALGWPDDGLTLPADRPFTVRRRLEVAHGRHVFEAVDSSGVPLRLLVLEPALAGELSATLRALHDSARAQGVALDVGLGADGAAAYCALYWPARSLDELLVRGARMAWQDAVGMAAAIARELHSQSSVGCTPRSLKPETVGLLARSTGEEVVLTDLAAAARVLNPSSGEAGSERAPGRWDSPQVADGEPMTAADGVYSLGLMLYRMLAGEHPLAGVGLRERLRRQSAGEIPPLPDEVAHALPPGLQSTLLAMLAPRREDRPALQTLIGALESFAAGRLPSVAAAAPEAAPDSSRRTPASPPSATAPPPPRPAAPAARSSRTTAWVLGACAVVALLVLLWVVLGSAPQAVETSDAAQRLASAQKVEVPMTVRSTPEDCAQCHPNHVLEWERSVMAHAARSPLFNALDMVIQEQLGRSNDCPNGAGVLRRADGFGACRDPQSGLSVTGAGGEHWCVNCHAPLERKLGGMQPWTAFGSAGSRAPMPSQLDETLMEGIGCTFCHQVTGPATGAPGQDGYRGNDTWRSFLTGRVFESRRADEPGIANSAYYHDPGYMFDGQLHPDSPARVHAVADSAAAEYLASSEFCGSCHDVRLFGTDVLGVEQRGEHFKRLRNGYSEWRAWKAERERAGQEVYSCQDCHMSLFPGVCDPQGSGGEADGCPPGTGFVPMAPGARATGGSSTTSDPRGARTTHYFSGVDVPLTPAFDARWSNDPTLDVSGLPLGFAQRRDLLLKNTFRLEIGESSLPDLGLRFDGRTLQVPVVIENVGAGHRVPAGFSQEREVWLHLRVTDAAGRLVYEVGRVDAHDADLRDKVFTRVTTDPDLLDAQGRPVGLFGADVIDGPDVPRWQPPPELGTSTRFRGKGLVNFQNGFLRCVRCIGTVKLDGSCEAPRGLEQPRAARYEDGQYDLDTGACISNLQGHHRFLEVWFPVGALDATRGLVRGPDAIIDTRSVPPGVPQVYTYALEATGFEPPFTVEATLNFRAFPPFLIRAFAEYEALQTQRGRRPDGPLLTLEALDRLEVIELERARGVVPR